MKKYNSKEMYFIRFGNLNLVKQKGYNVSELSQKEIDKDPWNVYKIFHSPPTRYGVYAFPLGGFTKHIMGGLNDEKRDRVKLYNLNKSYDLFNPDEIKEVKKIIKCGSLKWFRSYVDFICEHKCETCEYIDNEEMCRNQHKYINFNFNRPKKFKYYGNIWHHLKYTISDSSLILDKHNEWILTDFDTWLDCYNRELANIRANKKRLIFPMFPMIPISKESLEVFIPNKI